MSRQNHDLEQELGVFLFECSPNRIQLTPAGASCLKDCMLALAEEAARRVVALAARDAPVIHVGYAPSPTVELLPRVLRKIRKTAPRTHVVLQDLA